MPRIRSVVLGLVVPALQVLTDGGTPDRSHLGVQAFERIDPAVRGGTVTIDVATLRLTLSASCKKAFAGCSMDSELVIAAKNNTSLAAVEKVVGEKLQARAQPGEYIADAGGNWQKK